MSNNSFFCLLVNLLFEKCLIGIKALTDKSYQDRQYCGVRSNQPLQWPYQQQSTTPASPARRMTKQFNVVRLSCDLWIHYSCSDMSEEMLKLLNMMKEQADSHAWSCKCCKSAVQNLNKKTTKIFATS